jgi:hypothetical protein
MMNDMRHKPSVSGVMASILVLPAALWSCAQAPTTTADGIDGDLLGENAKNSYALGMEMGSKLHGPGLDLDAEAVARGVKDGITGTNPLLTETEMKGLLATFRSDYKMKQQEALRQQRVAAGEGVLARIRFAFKPDARIANGTYAATPAWVAPQRFSGASGQDTVQVMAGGLDATGQPVPVVPIWTASDPDLVEISPRNGNVAEIKAKRAGESTVTVAAGDISAILVITAEDRAGELNVLMTQAY